MLRTIMGWDNTEKAHRWLGYAQALSVMLGLTTLEEMKQTNKEAMMLRADIDYGDGGKASLWTPNLTEDNIEQLFYHFANQCFGIRKSITGFSLLALEEDIMPEPYSQLPDATIMLKHGGDHIPDIIVWNSTGQKIKSEWDR
jgi:hypothetical protein